MARTYRREWGATSSEMSGAAPVATLVVWDHADMGIEHHMLHLTTPDLAPLVAEIDRIAARGDAQEWISISPWVDPEDLPITSALRRIFSAKGSRVPEVTWVPAHEGEPAQVGVIHPTGPNAHERLADQGVVMPVGWRKISDHSKRGLLYALPGDADSQRVASTAIEMAAALSGVPTDDRWVAQVSAAV